MVVSDSYGSWSLIVGFWCSEAYFGHSVLKQGLIDEDHVFFLSSLYWNNIIIQHLLMIYKIRTRKKRSTTIFLFETSLDIYIDKVRREMTEPPIQDLFLHFFCIYYVICLLIVSLDGIFYDIIQLYSNFDFQN